jgi:adenosylcobinamide kinase/adenosylcobinamide-phosphate guanylyltransferase
MAILTLISGGVRSGKSACAEKIAISLPGSRAYIATCPVIDAETETRIARHRERRAADNWTTFEEETELAAAIRRASAHDIVLIECLTLWINNLMWRAEQRGGRMYEDDITKACREVLLACAEHPGHIIMVINEVGLGVIPENAAARQFCDLSGRCAQTVAAASDNVIFTSCGLPLVLKGALPCA